jgi:hypothetical protein
VGNLREQFEVMIRKYEGNRTLGRPRRRYGSIMKIGK